MEYMKNELLEQQSNTASQLKWYRPDERVKLGCIMLPIALVLIIPFSLLANYLMSSLKIGQPLVPLVPLYVALLYGIKRKVDKKGKL